VFLGYFGDILLIGVRSIDVVGEVDYFVDPCKFSSMKLVDPSSLYY
jgi:hypothetical protein